MRINFHGAVGPSGYGRFTTFLVPALIRAGIDVSVLPIYAEELRVADPSIRQLINFADEDILSADVAVRMSIANPSDAVGFFGKKRVLYTMLEVDKIPPFWVRSLNTVDQVWSPSHWGTDVFKNSGVKEKLIRVVPGGVDTNIFNPYREPILPKSDNFRFIFVGKWEIRKGIDILAKAFSEEFKEKEKVELILHCDTIKMFDGNFNSFKELVKYRLPVDRAEIKVSEGIIPNYHDMGRIYTSADCYVQPTRGEGWNLPLIEAMASGLPSIITNWSAHTEFANEKNAYLLNKFKLEPAIHPDQIAQFFLQYGKWAVPDKEELKKQMRYVFDNQEEAKKLGEKAAKDMQKWTWDEAAKKAKKCLEELI